MAIAHVATEYVFSDFLLKEPSESKYKGVRLELAVDKIVTCISVGLPLLLISLAFAQEVSVGTQISCFSPSSFSWRQAAFVDSFCWAAVQKHHLLQNDSERVPLWLHKFFPYILLLVAILMYIPSLFWRFTAAPHLYSDLAFIMEELDRSYNRSIKLAKSFTSNGKLDSAAGDTRTSLWDLTEGCFRYPLVEQYLKTKKSTKNLIIKYLICRIVTFIILLFACIYLGYYINLASITDEFKCSIRTGILKNQTDIPQFFQCKLIAVGVFQLLSYVNLIVYTLLAPVVIYTILVPIRQSSDFLKAYQILPAFGVLEFSSRFYDDLSLYLLFLEENLSELKSYKCLKVLEHLQVNGEEGFDAMCLLRNLGQVKTDTVDGKLLQHNKTEVEPRNSATELKDLSNESLEDGVKKDRKEKEDQKVRQRLLESTSTC